MMSENVIRDRNLGAVIDTALIRITFHASL